MLLRAVLGGPCGACLLFTERPGQCGSVAHCRESGEDANKPFGSIRQEERGQVLGWLGREERVPRRTMAGITCESHRWGPHVGKIAVSRTRVPFPGGLHCASAGGARSTSSCPASRGPTRPQHACSRPTSRPGCGLPCLLPFRERLGFFICKTGIRKAQGPYDWTRQSPWAQAWPRETPPPLQTKIC